MFIFRPFLAKELQAITILPLKKQLLFCNHALDVEDFSIFTTNNDFKVNLVKNCLILLKRASNLNFLITKEEIFTVW